METTTERRPVTINRPCNPVPDRQEASRRNTVVFNCAHANATVDFPNGTPFTEEPPYLIRRGIPRELHVRDDVKDKEEYEYTVSCGEDTDEDVTALTRTLPKILIRDSR